MGTVPTGLISPTHGPGSHRQSLFFCFFFLLWQSWRGRRGRICLGTWDWAK